MAAMLNFYSAFCAGGSDWNELTTDPCSSLLRRRMQFTIDKVSAKMEKMIAHMGEAPTVAAPARFSVQKIMLIIR